MNADERLAGAGEVQLVNRARSGDREAFRLLVERYQQKVFQLVLRLVKDMDEAQDLTQEAFVKAFFSLPDFKGDSAFYSWLYRIAYNLSLDQLRKKERKTTDYLEEFVGFEPSESTGTSGKIDGPHEALERKEQAQALLAEFKELSEEHRTAITLREVDGLSYEDIASVTGVSKGTVMSRLFYARKRLQQALQQFAPPLGGQRGGSAPPGSESSPEISKINLQKTGSLLGKALSIGRVYG